MKTIKLILALVTILSLLGGTLSSIWGLRQKARADNLENNLYEKTISYEDKLGRTVVEKTRLEIKFKDLKRVHKKDSSTLNAYELKLLQIAKELSASERKYRDVQTALLVSMETSFEDEALSKDTLINSKAAKYVSFDNSFGKYLATYSPETDSMRLEVLQKNELFVDMFRERKPNQKGKQVFWPVRWAKGWQYKGSIKTLNDSTVVSDFTLLNINRRK